VSELDGLPQQEWQTLTLIQALDALRDGLRPFVVHVLEEKEGPHWFNHPRVQRMLPAPPDLEGDAHCGTEAPVLDLALLLELIGSDCYWYRTFRPRLPSISRWQIDSLRELRNRLAHNDGSDPLFKKAALSCVRVCNLPPAASFELLRHSFAAHAFQVQMANGAPALERQNAMP